MFWKSNKVLNGKECWFDPVERYSIELVEIVDEEEEKETLLINSYSTQRQ